MTIELYKQAPKGWQSDYEIASCYLQVGDEYLFLKRAAGSLEEHTWSVPSGKLEKGESPLEAMQRELLEEIALNVEHERFAFLKSYFLLKGYRLSLHTFHLMLPHKPEIMLNEEHSQYCWQSLNEALDKTLERPLISGAELIIKELQRSCISQ